MKTGLAAMVLVLTLTLALTAVLVGAVAIASTPELLPVETDLVLAEIPNPKRIPKPMPKLMLEPALQGVSPSLLDGLDEYEPLVSGPELGRIVVLPPAALPRPSVKWKLRGYFLADSLANELNRRVRDGANLPIPASPDFQPRTHLLDEHAIALEIDPTNASFREHYAGVALRLVNRSAVALEFEVDAARLYLVQEALDPQGRWRPVESLDEGDCGVGYTRIRLGPGEHWKLTAARYQGSFPTLLRFKLKAGRAHNWRGPAWFEDVPYAVGEATDLARAALPDWGLPEIYSAPYVGSVNPEQFTRPRPAGASELREAP